MGKNLLLVIDPQNDFVSNWGSLYIKGAEDIVRNLGNWIVENSKIIDDICLTQDTHYRIHIGHSVFWKENPMVGTRITLDDVLSGKYNPINYRDEVIKYLETKGSQVIWPEHCIFGSIGWAFPEDITLALGHWSIVKEKEYEIFMKGKTPYIDGYSALRGNQDLANKILEYDRVYIAGFARDYCVAETVRDMLFMIPNDYLFGKLVFLESCMASIIPGERVDIYDKAIEKYGARSL